MRKERVMGVEFLDKRVMIMSGCGNKTKERQKHDPGDAGTNS